MPIDLQAVRRQCIVSLVIGILLVIPVMTEAQEQTPEADTYVTITVSRVDQPGGCLVEVEAPEDFEAYYGGYLSHLDANYQLVRDQLYSRIRTGSLTLWSTEWATMEYQNRDIIIRCADDYLAIHASGTPIQQALELGSDQQQLSVAISLYSQAMILPPELGEVTKSEEWLFVVTEGPLIQVTLPIPK